jgi:hypothetical protein
MKMTRDLAAHSAYAALVIAGFALGCSLLAAARPCSNRNMTGSYVVTMSGFITSATPPQFLLGAYAPVTVIGTYTFDGDGKASRFLTVNAAGLSFPVTDFGSYQINPDCSGSATFQTNSETMSFAPIDGQVLAIVSTTPGESGTGTLTKQNIAHCGSLTLSGTYIFSANGLGTLEDPPQAADAFFPVAVMGTWTFDGRGAVARSLALSFAGFPGPYDDAGTYQVKPDCTASVYFPSDSEPFNLILIDGKRAVFGVTALGRSGTGMLIKQDLDD